MAKQHIKLSSDIVVPCPLVNFALRRVHSCLTCNHYKGINQATQNGEPIEGNEADIYQIVCGKPITRRLQRIEE